MIVVIGSVAQNWHKQTRTPSDLDIIASYDDARMFIKALGKIERIKEDLPTEGGKKIVVKTDKRVVEIEVAWCDSSAGKLIDIVSNKRYVDTIEIAGVVLTIPCLDVLYMVKSSHKYKKNSIYFLKTLTDIHMMRDMGAGIPEDCMEWFKQREKETYVNTLPKLNVAKKDFFTDDVPYTYDHDSVHMAIKFLDKPAYQYFKQDENEVMVSREMFFKLPRQIQLLSVVEEAMTLAIERALVPFPDGMNPKQAFDYALSKCCTSIASGFWREFAHDNYFAVQELYDPNYFERFKLGVESGIVRSFSK